MSIQDAKAEANVMIGRQKQKERLIRLYLRLCRRTGDSFV